MPQRYAPLSFKNPTETSDCVKEKLVGTSSQEKSDEKTDITPLKDFDWQNIDPAKHRPFKPVYHITMGTTNLAHESCLHSNGLLQ